MTMDHLSLPALGWTVEWAAKLAQLRAAMGDTSLLAARVMRQESGGALLVVEGHEDRAILGRLPGRWRLDHSNKLERPVTGDWLAVSPPQQDDLAIIRAILPRASLIARQAAGHKTESQPIAANIDLAFIVSGLDGDFNPRRIDRMLSLVEESRIPAVILLNKADLVPVALAKQAEKLLRERGLTQPIHCLSAQNPQDAKLLEPYLHPGQLVTFLGTSGVGKSTLINQMIGKAVQETQPVRRKDQRGRHTTTRREIFPLPNGTLLMDMPGLREIQFWQEEETAPKIAGFSDIDALAAQCRFRDCRHEGEPGCAVEAAIERNEIDAERAEHYRKLRSEAHIQAERQTKSDWRRHARLKRFVKSRRRMDKHSKGDEDL